MKRTTSTLAGVLLAASLASPAIAGPIYQYDSASPRNFGGGTGAGYDSISMTYNSMSQHFSFEVDYSGLVADGGWLVVSEGPNPKQANDELAILYFDSSSQDVWAYAYNGLNNSASYLTTSFLGYFDDAYQTNGDVASLSIDASGINSMLNGSGISFGPKIGIWFHPAFGLTAVGGSDGLLEWGYRAQGWYDTSNDGHYCENQRRHGGCVTTVPEPGTLALLIPGLALIAARRRKRA
ncbi:MAG: PEP-CTERM sorting domain-containing protein [Pseudomonadota bacterium]